MSIMLENNVIEQVISGGFLPRKKVMPSFVGTKDRAVVRRMVVKDEIENGSVVLDPCSSSSSSSIGMNSDDDDDDKSDENDDDEVESKLNNSPFDSAADALEQALPIRRGISKFYNGKSKSFASLADAACSSVEDITKEENAYSRKRKNMLAYSLLYDKSRTSLRRIPSMGGGISKRSACPKAPNRSSLAFAVAVNNCDSRSDEYSSVAEGNGNNNSRTPSISPPLTPIPPPPWRSFSLGDLQHCAVTASALNSNLSSPLVGKRTKSEDVS